VVLEARCTTLVQAHQSVQHRRAPSAGIGLQSRRASFTLTLEDTLMINKQFFEDMTQQLTRLLPQAEAAGEEARKTMAAVLQKGFASLDLLTRDEFEAQSAALARAEERLAHLEQEVVRLEALMKEQGKA
jgi:BMFP domain-containing protein YqiC